MSFPPLPPVLCHTQDLDEQYTADQMQAYGQQCFHLGMAQAAKKEEINEKD